MKKLYVIGAITLALGGCSTTQMRAIEQNHVAVVKTVSTFDNATVITNKNKGSLYGNPFGPYTNKVLMSGYYTTAHPEVIMLNISYIDEQDLLSLNKISFNIDGEMFESIAPNTTDYGNLSYATNVRQSTNNFVIPLSLANKIANAKDVRVRIHTSKGFIDRFLVKPDEQEPQSQATKAIVYILNEINSTK